MRVRGQTMEAWSDDWLTTGNRTDRGWLIKIYDLRDPIWPCIATFYSLGKGTWMYAERQSVSTVRSVSQKPVFGSTDYTRVLRRKKS